MSAHFAIGAALLALSACGPTAPQMADAPEGGGSGKRDAAPGDSQMVSIDAKTVACPPGLPDSFGQLGTLTTTKNGPGSPAMYDSYNVFSRLQGNQRWFFAMNFYKGRGIYAGGFMLNTAVDIQAPDNDETTCSLCINLFADLDTTPGGPSLHLFGREGKVKITSQSSDQTSVSGTLEDIILEAIEIVYDAQSTPCSDDINDPVCGNGICLNHQCGRQQLLAGCSTSIKSATF
jgi:hypothetical protein